MDDEVLILLVQNYRELYDTFDPNYMNNIRRINCWEEIASQMNNSTAEECKKRWTQIRENYRKAKLRFQKTKTGQAVAKKRPVKFEKELGFLNDCFNEQRRQIDNVNDEDQDTTEADILPTRPEDNNCSPTAMHNSPGAVALSPASLSPAPPSSSPRSPAPGALVSTTTQPATRYGRKAQTNLIAEYFKYKKELQETNQCSKVAQVNKNDHLSKFFQAMEESVRGFPPYLQVEAKTRISATVLQLEAQAVQCTQQNQELQYHQLSGGYKQLPQSSGQYSGGSQQPGSSFLNPQPTNQYAQQPSNQYGQQPPNQQPCEHCSGGENSFQQHGIVYSPGPAQCGDNK